jgi:hypothetical protein
MVGPDTSTENIGTRSIVIISTMSNVRMKMKKSSANRIVMMITT